MRFYYGIFCCVLSMLVLLVFIYMCLTKVRLAIFLCLFNYLMICLFVVFCFLVFFFKQKKAYEMRISDWSSDVCSSDLVMVAYLHGEGVPPMPRTSRRTKLSPSATFSGLQAIGSAPHGWYRQR